MQRREEENNFKIGDVEIDSMTIEQLKHQLARRNLSKTGNKTELLLRLKQALEGGREDIDEARNVISNSNSTNKDPMQQMILQLMENMMQLLNNQANKTISETPTVP